MKTFLRQHDLIYEAAPLQWVDGIPLANGDMGVVLWGNGGSLNLSPDQYDVWELRDRLQRDPARYNYRHLRKLVGDKNQAEILKTFQGEPGKGRPEITKLPLPRITIDFGVAARRFDARLSLYNAVVEGKITFPGAGINWSAFTISDENLFVFEFETIGRLLAPEIRINDGIFDTPGQEAARLGAPNVRTLLRQWGYPDPVTVTQGDEISYYQAIPGNGGYAIAMGKARCAGRERIAVSVIWHPDGEKARTLSRRIVTRGLAAGRSGLLKRHVVFWHSFWQKSFLTIPDSRLENLYYVELYKLGACCKGKTACPLQGLWTSGDGDLPPWRGDYHLNQNVQQTYWPIYAGNHLELGRPLYAMFSKALPQFIKHGKEFFGREGALAPGACGPKGNTIRGWVTVTFWPGNGAWLAHMYWLHWKYSMDRTFLEKQAYPFMRAFMRTYLNLVEKGPDGKYHIPLSVSPEWGGNGLDAWHPDTSCDLFLARWLAAALLETVKVLDIDDEDAPRWHDFLDMLIDVPEDETGINLWPDQPQPEPYVHFGHLLGLFPLDLVTIEGTDRDRSVIRRTMARLLRLGTSRSAGFTMPWLAHIAARTGYSNIAWKLLQDYFYFIAPNTFHLNGDWRHFGVSCLNYAPMTLEAGFCYANALMNMLLQSWGGVIRVFPAVPDFWPDAYFRDLRAEGAFRVTARRRNGHILFVQITSEQGGRCKVKNVFGTDADLVCINRGQSAVVSGSIFSFATRKGDRFLLKPKGRRITENDLREPGRTRSRHGTNWFGLKKIPRF